MTTPEEAKKMENSELVAVLMMTRDDLISIRRKMWDGVPDLEELFDSVRENYDTLLNELYRRMRR